ncbi:bifunctional UDP-sugar hydrolase/5'-nucleotidase [Bdellovibrionota bacterium FG-1]
MIRLGLLLGFALFGASHPVFAKLLQILHTNDLHSHLEHAEDRSIGGYEAPQGPKGGYAQLKAVIDRYKASAAAEGVETLVLDAGDFTEGTPYFLADQGEQSWRIMNEMGYDAVTLGNHDYLMGQKDLNRIVGHVRPKFALLAANFDFSNKLKNLRRYLFPYAQFKKAGARIAVIGLTTDEFVYQWRAGRDVIYSPQEGLTQYIDEARAHNDYVILLSHLGLPRDRSIVAHSSDLDLVVGGHSHTFLEKVAKQKDFLGRRVPIVQAGQHGQVMGRLVVDLVPGHPLKIMSYELISVDHAGPKDPVIEALVQQAQEGLNRQFGDQWLHEVIGISEVPMVIPSDGPTVWGTLVADAMKNAVGADLSIDAGGQLFGDNMSGGLLTRQKLFSFYPRVFGFQEKQGWTIWTIQARGWVLRTIMEIAMDQGINFNVSGASYDTAKEAGLWRIKNFKISGRSVEDFRTYRVALPEGIGRAVLEISPVFQIWMHHPTDSGYAIWSAIEAELMSHGGIVK